MSNKIMPEKQTSFLFKMVQNPSCKPKKRWCSSAAGGNIAVTAYWSLVYSCCPGMLKGKARKESEYRCKIPKPKKRCQQPAGQQECSQVSFKQMGPVFPCGEDRSSKGLSKGKKLTVGKGPMHACRVLGKNPLRSVALRAHGQGGRASTNAMT